MTEAFDRLAHRYDAWYATPRGTCLTFMLTAGAVRIGTC